MDKSFFEAFRNRHEPKSIIREEVTERPKELVEALSRTLPMNLSENAIHLVVAGHLSLLTPEAYGYFLPAFMTVCLEDHAQNSVFASELLSSLTRPVRRDIVDAFELLEKNQKAIGLSADNTELLQGQLDWFDRGVPEQLFQERAAMFTAKEAEAILQFLFRLKAQFGDCYLFGEIDRAIDRHWKVAASNA